MALVYNKQLKRYVDAGTYKDPSVKKRKNYNFSLPIGEFNKRYGRVKYTPQEFGELARTGYVASFGDGQLGLKAPAYSVQNALQQIRTTGTAAPNYIDPGYRGSNLVPLALMPNPTPGDVYNYMKKASKYDLAGYIQRYGHPPSPDSSYYQFYKPQAAIDEQMDDIRSDAVKAYGVEADRDLRYSLLALARETKDPAIQGIADGLPILREGSEKGFTSSQRKRAKEVLSDFGLTGLGSTTIPKDLGSKYTFGVAEGQDKNKTLAERAASSPFMAAVSPLLAMGANEDYQNFLNDPKGPLSPTPVSEYGPFSIFGNLAKGAIRATLGIPMGMYELAVHPEQTVKAIAQDYKKRYGAPFGVKDSNFIESSLEDPLSPILDVLSLVPIIGWAAKGAQVAKVASVGARMGDIAEASRTVESVKPAWRGPLGEPLKAEDLAALDEYNKGLKIIAARKDLTKMSSWQFAKFMRGVERGNSREVMRWSAAAPEGLGGMNSAYVPGAMDKAAALFEPRWIVQKLGDVLPEEGENAGEIASINAKIREDLGIGDNVVPVAFRQTGSPLARGAQRIFLTAQKELAKKANNPESAVPARFASAPVIGYNWRYGRAAKTHEYAPVELVARALHSDRLQRQVISDFDLDAGEELAIMNDVHGKAADPAVLRAVALRRVAERVEKGVPDTDLELANLQASARILEDKQLLDSWAKAKKEMSDLDENGVARTERGRQLRKARETYLLKRQRAMRLIGAEMADNSRAIKALTLRYQPILNAFGLDRLSVLEELGPENLQNMALLNANWHKWEIDGDDFLPPEGQLFDPDNYLSQTDAELRKVLQETRDALQDDMRYRGSNGAPIVRVDGVFEVNGKEYVQFRRMRLDGEFEGGYENISRKGLLDETPMIAPKEVFMPANKGTVGMISRDAEKVLDLIDTASLNAVNKMFPNVRDYVDKVGRYTFEGRETFRGLTNRNEVAASGLMSWQLDVQHAAHVSSITRRMGDIADVLESNAVAIPVDMYDPKVYSRLRSLRLFYSKKEADDYARNYREGQDPREVIETTYNGSPVYAVRMRFFDETSLALKEAREQDILSSEEWYRAYIDDGDTIDATNPDRLVMVVPKDVVKKLRESYKRSDTLAGKVLKGATDWFKILALSLSPRFISQQIIGSTTMLMLAHPIQAPMIMARAIQYAARRGGSTTRMFMDQADDLDIITNRFIRDIEDNIFLEDSLKSQTGRLGRTGESIANIGFTLSRAFEMNMRASIVKQAALNYPGFKEFMNSEKVAARAATGIPEMGYPKVSKFHAAFDLMTDPNSPDFDPNLLRETRHTADMVMGNYRDFSNSERMVRNFMMPFYAWTRHSAMFTKRLVQENPLTANSLANIGDYGYEQVLETGGLPDWLLESIPMPDVLEKVIGLDPSKDNRLGFSSISPFGTFGRLVQDVSGAAGADWSKGTSGFVGNNASPFVKTVIEQTTGRSLLSDGPVEQTGLLNPQTYVDGFESFPAMKNLITAFKTQSQLNEMRGRENPEDIFKDPYDPESKLSIPGPKLSEQFGTSTPAGIWNAVSPLRAYSLNPESLGKQVQQEYKERMDAYQTAQKEREKGAQAVVTRLLKWKAKRDYVMNVWMPAFANKNPELARRVLEQLEKEYPDIPEYFSSSTARQIVND